jgi:hypothetical protein
MFGSFSENALLAYAEKVKKVVASQGTEWADAGGVGEEDHTYIDTDESQDADDYAELYDYTTCIRLVNLKKRPETDTEQLARQGVFNKSQWD